MSSLRALAIAYRALNPATAHPSCPRLQNQATGQAAPGMPRNLAAYHIGTALLDFDRLHTALLSSHHVSLARVTLRGLVQDVLDVGDFYGAVIGHVDLS